MDIVCFWATVRVKPRVNAVMNGLVWLSQAVDRLNGEFDFKF